MSGFAGRLKNSFVGLLFGFVMIPGSIVLHAWNEYRTIHRSRGLNEAADVVVSIPDTQQLAVEWENRLVHLSGPATTEEILVDETFGIRTNAVHLARRVEMYQWIEDEETNDEGHTEYEYRRGWHPGRVNSSAFHQGGYENPSAEYAAADYSAQHVTIGVYELNDVLQGEMNHWEPIALNQAAILETLGREQTDHVTVQDNQVYWSHQSPNPDDPQIGDQRIRFEKVAPGTVSLVSRLRGNSFEKFTTSNGETIERLYMGAMSSEEVMLRLMTENTLLAWGLRLLGFALCVIGFSLVLGPLVALVSWIPILGDLTRGLLFLAGVLLGLAVSLTTISLSWIAVRPLLALALLAIAVLAGWVILKLHKSTREEPPVIDADMIVQS